MSLNHNGTPLDIQNNQDTQKQQLETPCGNVKTIDHKDSFKNNKKARLRRSIAITD